MLEANKLMTLQAVMSLISHEINQRLGSTILNAEAAQPILQVDPPNLEEVRFFGEKRTCQGASQTDI